MSKFREAHCLKTLGTIYPVMRCYTPEEWTSDKRATSIRACLYVIQSFHLTLICDIIRMCRDFMRNARNRRCVFSVLATSSQRKQQALIGTVVVNVMAKGQTHGQANNHAVTILLYLYVSSCKLQKIQRACTSGAIYVCTRVGTLIVATIYLQLIQNRYMVQSFTVLHCSHQHCVQPIASDVEVVGYL